MMSAPNNIRRGLNRIKENLKAYLTTSPPEIYLFLDLKVHPNEVVSATNNF